MNESLDLTNIARDVKKLHDEIGRLRGVLANASVKFTALNLPVYASIIDAALAEGNGQEGGV